MMKKIQIQKSIFSANDKTAAANRKYLNSLDICTINVMASPGAGKTSLILKLLKSLPKKPYKAVIEGDTASRVDAEKVIKAGYDCVQINTAGGCHLTSSMIKSSIKELNPKNQGYVFIENIGNLICPSSFDLGESIKMVISSVPEGDDKPVKYPSIFSIADIIVLNKIDYMKSSDFKLSYFLKGIKAVNQRASVFLVSCKSNAGIKQLVRAIISLWEHQKP